MPLYEYVCPDCKLEFERVRSMKQCQEPRDCPRCGHQAERLPSLFCRSLQDAGSPGCSTCSATSCRSCH